MLWSSGSDEGYFLRLPLAARLRVCEAKVKGLRANPGSPHVKQGHFLAMEWSGTEARKPKLGVWRMALALVLAAFLGGALGLIWQNTGLGGDEEANSAAASVAE